MIFEETIFPLCKTPLPAITEITAPKPMLVADQPENEQTIEPEIIEIDIFDDDNDYQQIPPAAQPAPQRVPPPQHPALQP